MKNSILIIALLTAGSVVCSSYAKQSANAYPFYTYKNHEYYYPDTIKKNCTTIHNQPNLLTCGEKKAGCVPTGPMGENQGVWEDRNDGKHKCINQKAV